MTDSITISPRLLGPLGFFGLLLLVLAVLGKVPLRYNVRNLLVRWKTTLLTVLAFTLVVALMTVMLAFVNGMYKLTENTGVPGNVLVLADGATDELFSNLGYGDITGLPAEYKKYLELDEKGEALVSWELY